MTGPDSRPGIMLTRDQLEAWAGIELTDEEVEDLAECISLSSIPDAINTIVIESMGITREDDEA